MVFLGGRGGGHQLALVLPCIAPPPHFFPHIRADFPHTHNFLVLKPERSAFPLGLAEWEQRGRSAFVCVIERVCAETGCGRTQYAGSASCGDAQAAVEVFNS